MSKSEILSISQYHLSGPSLGSSIPRPETSYEQKYNSPDREDELDMFKIFGANAEAFYNIIYNMEVNGNYLVSFMSRVVANPYTNMELLLEILYVLKTYTNDVSDESNYQRGVEVLNGVREMYENGEVLPWDNIEDGPLKRLKMREETRNAQMESSGRDTGKACGRGGCEETYVVTTAEQLTSGDEAMKKVVRCIECGYERNG